GFIAGMSFDAFASDQRTHDAVVRCIEIISEASRRVGPELRARHPHIPWRDVADAGNLYRHSYHRVALDIVWKTVHDPLLEIIAACRAEVDPPAP
ncbi:HepT-like ribonuclease domain-containing protein, partial [Methylobacterium sp. A54F]